ncbi:MAG TPA: SUMF1/EgtB/PvdO family nonheme iron enzyme, partial [bacterium]|nr:SUMF1/EgtB/PvdO family nonheme iron enzyme [bacterium]
PAGPFMMGCNEEVDALCGGNEKPYHEVTLSAYKIGKYEVTTKEYRKCISAGFCSNNGAYVHYYTTSPYCNLSKSSKEDHPVQCVTWYGAKAYCAWKGGRLPTEAEWEKAARGTDGRKYPWGNEPEASCEYAVINDGGWGCGGGGTMPVGSKPLGVSPYGVHDMIGNVRELVNDYYDEGYYAVSPEVDPQGPESGTLRVGRGGCWWDIDQYLLRTSFRGGEGPDPFYLDIWGFRCAE